MAVKQKNGRWYFQFQIRGKEYHRAIPEATSRRDAEKAEIRFKSDLLQGKYDLIENKGKQTFEELEKVYTEYAKVNKKTWKNERWVVEKMLLFFKGKQLKDISPMMIEKYRSERKKQGKKDGSPLKNATINREIEILRKMFSIAVDNDWLDNNPASAKKIKLLREDNKQERYLEKDEEVRLLNACTGIHSYMKPILICALHTGMRRGEILNLKWECVDLKKRYIVLLETKSGKRRNVPISSTLLEELQTLKKNATTEFVFTNPQTGLPYYDVKRSYETIRDNAEIKGLRFHDLRHTAATRMVASGVDLATVQSILGHADLKTTSRYAHPVPEQKLKAVEALNNYNELLNSSTEIKASKCISMKINRHITRQIQDEKQTSRQNVDKLKLTVLKNNS